MKIRNKIQVATSCMLPQFNVNNVVPQVRTGGCARCSYNKDTG